MTIGNHLRADQRGFTLAELLVAIAILGLVMLGVLTLLMTGNESYLTGSNQAEAQGAVRAALERMTTDIREGGYDPTATGCLTGPPPGCWYAVSNPTANSFVIQSDWNGDGVINPAIQVPVTYCGPGAGVGVPPCTAPGFPVATVVNRGKQVTYSVVGGSLCRQESAIPVVPPDPLCPAGFVSLVTSVQQAATGQNCAGAQIALPPFFQYCDANGNPPVTTDQIKTVVVNLQVGVQNQPPVIWQAGAIQVTMSDRIRLRNR